jgi:competence protein ComEC
MKSVLRSISLLIATVILLAGCSTPYVPIQQTAAPTVDQHTQAATTPSQTATTSPQSQFSTTPSGSLQVHFIDVGQGDSVLIQTSGGTSMLIDGGDTDMGIVQYLKSKGVTQLDTVVATHPHADHIGGLVQVLKAIPVAKVVTNGQPTTTKTYENFLDAIAAAKSEYVEVKRGDSLHLDNIVFTVLNPVSINGDDLNNNSLVLRLVYGKVSFLFEGDAQAEAEASMAASSVSLVSATILKVGHHGSRTSSSPAFLSLVKPEVAIYSAGRNNAYGHPHPETLMALAAVGATVYGTDVNGTIIVTTDGNTYKVSPTTGQPRGPPSVQPTSSPTSSPAIAPATTPSVVAPSSLALSLEVTSVTSPVAPGANATLLANTFPSASCTITVYYKSGPSTASGLTPKTADANGNVSWTWKVGTNTTPGNWRISVTASKDGQSVTKETTFTVGK